MDANGAKRQSGSTYRKQGRIAVSVVRSPAVGRRQCLRRPTRRNPIFAGYLRRPGIAAVPAIRTGFDSRLSGANSRLGTCPKQVPNSHGSEVIRRVSEGLNRRQSLAYASGYQREVISDTSLTAVSIEKLTALSGYEASGLKNPQVIASFVRHAFW